MKTRVKKKKNKNNFNDINIDYPAPSNLENSMVKSNNNNSNQYDLIINIDSIRFLNEPGWKIEYFESNYDKEEIKKIVGSSKMTVISVLGNSNRGKTHILNKLSGVKLKSGFQIQTKGLSIKIDKEKDIILLDTAGTNAPLLVEEKRSFESISQKERDHIHLCQIITNYILQAFVIKQAHILICVIGMLTASEQNFLNKIKKFSKNKKKLIVIHNLIKCTKEEEIIKYKDEVLLKMISNKLEERNIPSFNDNREPLFNKYFIEKDDEDIMHFIYCNDDENKSKDLDFYNKTTLNFILKCIKIELVKPINIIQNLKDHIKEISSLVLKEEIVSLTKEDDYIKCTNKEIKPKEILYDGYDDIIFIGKEYEPMYRYYVKDDSFIIEIDLCSNYIDLNVMQKFDKNTKETIFTITGERNIENVEEYEELISFGNKRENYKRFKLDIKLKLKDIGIKHLKKDYNIEMKLGILFLIYKFNK